MEMIQENLKPYGYIYKVTNLINNKIYIGQTKKKVNYRWNQHVYKSKRLKQKDGKCPYLHNAISKYGKNSFKVEVIDTANNLLELNVKEERWIKDLNSIAPNGYNLSSGGNQTECNPETRAKLSKASTGRKHSIETKLRLAEIAKNQMKNPEYKEILRQKNLGKKHTPETIQKMKESRKGKPLTEKNKKALSEARMGMKFSESHKRNMSHSRLGKPMPKTNEMLEKMGRKWFQVYDIEGNLLGTYINQRKCAKDLKVKPSQVTEWITGKVKSKKYTFQFLEKEVIHD